MDAVTVLTESTRMATPPKRRSAKPAGRGKPAKPTLGSLLRALRVRNGWTLKQMSERTGIPFSTLSKVEHDRLTLSYDKLQQLGESLNMRMSELFAEPEEVTDTQRMTRLSVGTVDRSIQINTRNYDYYYLCPELRRKRMIPILSRVRARSLEEFGELVRHSGEEWYYVVQGNVEVHTEFYEVISLKEGEAVYIDSAMGHAYLLGPGCDEALIIGACSSADEDQMGSLFQAHTAEGE
jgi:transcriptional regulator with XRE-family HTH domain